MGESPLMLEQERESRWATGWFGVPGGDASDNPKKAHVYSRRWNVTACGWKPRRELQFQFCAQGVHEGFIDCKRCRQSMEVADDE